MTRDDALRLIDGTSYGVSGPPHALWTELRQHAPVVRLAAAAGYEPFWAITRYDDVRAVSSLPDVFSNAGGILHPSEEMRRMREEAFGGMESIIDMDPPKHRAYRKVARDWFSPRAASGLHATIAGSARALVDRMADGDLAGASDFAQTVASQHPLTVLTTVLGGHPADEPLFLEMANAMFGADDPEMQAKGADRAAAVQDLRGRVLARMLEIIAEKRAAPDDGLASVIANGRIDGEPLGLAETLGYFGILLVAGHDTTKNALTTGLQALMDHPEEIRRVQRQPELMPALVEEIVRWATPVNYMRRTAVADAEVGGQTIRAGERLLLFYASANRDEAVFDAPFAFRADRSPNPHLGFGHGEHFCIGAHLARHSIHGFFSELLPRLYAIMPAGTPVWANAAFVVGYKHLPIRYEIGPARSAEILR